MKLRFPLYLKILAWFFLNLAFLGAIFYGFFGMQFRFGLDSFLLGQASERIQAVARTIAFDLESTPQKSWNSVLQRFSGISQRSP